MLHRPRREKAAAAAGGKSIKGADEFGGYAAAAAAAAAGGRGVVGWGWAGRCPGPALSTTSASSKSPALTAKRAWRFETMRASRRGELA